MGDGGEAWHGSPWQLLSCTQPSPCWRGKTSGLSPCPLPDRDECEQPSTCRGQRCINTPGSYRCECNEGFAMGPRGQCEGEACCSLFPCPSNPPCAGLNTFPHHSVSSPGREEGPPPSLSALCSSPPWRVVCPLLCRRGQAFLGRERERCAPKILSHLPREIPHDQPTPASHSGRRCLSIFMPP